MSFLADHRRWVTGLVLATYCALAIGSHALHDWVGCRDGNCSPQVAGCQCGMPHADEPIDGEEVFTNDVAIDRRHPVGPLGDSCHETGSCAICQYHAQGQLAVDAAVPLAIHLPARLLLRVGGLRASAQRPWESLPRGPPSRHETV